MSTASFRAVLSQSSICAAARRAGTPEDGLQLIFDALRLHGITGVENIDQIEPQLAALIMLYAEAAKARLTHMGVLVTEQAKLIDEQRALLDELNLRSATDELLDEAPATQVSAFDPDFVPTDDELTLLFGSGEQLSFNYTH